MTKQILAFFILLHKRAKPILPPYFIPHLRPYPLPLSIYPPILPPHLRPYLTQPFNPSVCPVTMVERMDVEPNPKKNPP